MTFLQTLHARLEAAAYKVTDNFCYSCYKVVTGQYCSTCHTDDFMRHLKGVGVEYGTEWVIEHLLKKHCQPVDGKERYEDVLNECYGRATVGNLTWDAGYVVKNLDPVAFRCGVSDYLADEETFVELSGDYYLLTDIETMLEELEEDD